MENTAAAGLANGGPCGGSAVVTASWKHHSFCIFLDDLFYGRDFGFDFASSRPSASMVCLSLSLLPTWRAVCRCRSWLSPTNVIVWQPVHSLNTLASRSGCATGQSRTSTDAMLDSRGDRFVALEVDPFLFQRSSSITPSRPYSVVSAAFDRVGDSGPFTVYPFFGLLGTLAMRLLHGDEAPRRCQEEGHERRSAAFPPPACSVAGSSAPTAPLMTATGEVACPSCAASFSALAFTLPSVSI